MAYGAHELGSGDWRETSPGEELARDLRLLDAPAEVSALALSALEQGAFVRVRGIRNAALTGIAPHLWIGGGAWLPDASLFERWGLQVARGSTGSIDAYWPEIPASTGVQGAQPPAHLDTTGNCAVRFQHSEGIGRELNRGSCIRSVDCSVVPETGEGETLETVPYEVGDRAAEVVRPFRPVKMGWRQAMRATARDLRRAGGPVWRKLADALETCGASAWTRSCADCGADVARVMPITGCDSRVCPFCARQAAQRGFEIADKAASLVENDQRILVEAALGTHEGRLTKLRSRRDNLKAEYKRTKARIVQKHQAIEAMNEGGYSAPGDYAELVKLRRSRGHLQWRLEKARDKVNACAARRDQLKQHRNWSWKFLTIGVRWDVDSWDSYTPRGMRERIKQLWQAASKIWKAVPMRRYSALTFKMEISDNGHIHLHGVFKGPFLNRGWINRIAFGEAWKQKDPMREGTVDVREIRDLAEALAAPDALNLKALEYAGRAIEAHVPEHREELSKVYPKTLQGGARELAEKIRGRKRLEERKRDPSAHRDALRQALREAIKYSYKTLTPLRANWIAGEKATMADPRLASRWIQATRRAQLQRHYGLMRLAMRQARKEYRLEREGIAQAAPTCIECGTDQPKIGAEHWHLVQTEAFAKDHKDVWSRSMTAVRRRNAFSTAKGDEQWVT